MDPSGTGTGDTNISGGIRILGVCGVTHLWNQTGGPTG